MTKSSGVERVFLGWHAPILARAAEWILERHGDDLGDVLIALPGARAARTLRFELARRARPSWTPPSVLTQGALTDELVLSERPVASRFARTLAWASALSSLAPKRFAAITRPRPHDRDLTSWLALAEPVRALHAELAEEGIAFDDVARRADARTDAGVDERLRARFAALAEAQALWRVSLDSLGLADPHESRFAAIERGSLDPKRRVVLVGVADVNRLLARLVQRLGARATALVLAPRELEDAFDELGCLRVESWKERELPIVNERWHVVEGPGAQAERAIEIAASFDARFAAHEVVLGIADEEVAPYLERRLAEQGLRAIDARGTPATRTPPATWLADLARYLDGRSFSALAALVRHPDAEASLARWKMLAGTDVATALDRCHRDHLPGRVEKGVSPDVDRVLTALETNLGDLTGGSRVLSAWAEPIRAAIESTYGSRELDLAVDEDRVLAEVLEHCAEALGEIERTPPEIASHAVSASAAIESMLLALRSLTVAPRALAPGETALDLVGWLDLALDPARAVIVTGFAEGRVPRAQGGDAYLPDALRRELGLPGRDARLARDVYAASVLVASCEEVHFVTARETRARDPLLPSRLAFHVPDAQLVDRVKGFLPDASSRTERRSPPSARELQYTLPRDPRPRAIDAMRVTAFRDYLESPYRFYLVHVLRLETLDDRARELDARMFGTFAHAVLARFADEGPSTSTDPRAIEDFLRGAIDERERELFGASPRAAVRLQCAQLARRMGFFASWQAQRAARGWRIAHAEWESPDAVALDLGDGSSMGITGRIDRIDVHDESGAWALLDYKTGARAKDPESAHKGRAGWRDLQLPLYTLLARSLALSGKRELGYVCVGRDACEVGERMASSWTDAHVGEALDKAREVARDVRAGKFFELGRVVPSEPILAAIAGRGLLAPAIASAGEGGDG